MTFIERPISAVFIALCVILIVAQVIFYIRRQRKTASEARVADAAENPAVPGVAG